MRRPPRPTSSAGVRPRLKIKPSREAIDAIVREHGGVILLLGTRSDESSSRIRRMENRATNSRGLNPHDEISDDLVMTPIVHWSNDEALGISIYAQPPWGAPMTSYWIYTSRQVAVNVRWSWT